jgi:hypothetical protein
MFLHGAVLVPSFWKNIVETPGDSVLNRKRDISSDDVVADPTCYVMIWHFLAFLKPFRSRNSHRSLRLKHIPGLLEPLGFRSNN